MLRTILLIVTMAFLWGALTENVQAHGSFWTEETNVCVFGIVVAGQTQDRDGHNILPRIVVAPNKIFYHRFRDGRTWVRFGHPSINPRRWSVVEEFYTERIEDECAVIN